MMSHQLQDSNITDDIKNKNFNNKCIISFPVEVTTLAGQLYLQIPKVQPKNSLTCYQIYNNFLYKTFSVRALYLNIFEFLLKILKIKILNTKKIYGFN